MYVHRLSCIVSNDEFEHSPRPRPNASKHCGGACGCFAHPGGTVGEGGGGTYVLEAAADAGLDVGAPEGGHLAQLPRDLDGVVQQEAQLPLVARVPRRRHLVEQVWRGGERGGLDTEVHRLCASQPGVRQSRFLGLLVKIWIFSLFGKNQKQKQKYRHRFC